MKEVIKSVYYCDHCKKRYFVKNACQEHEDNCSRKPENKNPCLEGCIHLEEATTIVEYDVGRHYCGEPITDEFKANCFRCKKLDILMFPHTAEKLNKKYLLEEQANKQYPMPKVTCEHFKLHDLSMDLFEGL